MKAGVSLNAFVAREERPLPTDVQEKSYPARIQEMPGIVGYLVQEGDTFLGYRALLPHDAGKNP